MPTLYVTEPGSVVRFAAGAVLVTRDDDSDGAAPRPKDREILIEVELHRLEMIALVGRVHITSAATQLCLERGISVSWFKWNGDYLGRMVPEVARSGDLRLLQYGRVSDPVRCLQAARYIVAAKLTNAGAVLRAIHGNYPGDAARTRAMTEIGRFGKTANTAGDLESLRGLEGHGASLYFTALRGAFRGDIRFAGRKRRPPPDPANALLSFGYVLLGSLLQGTIEARGLDPALGVFHAVRPGRPSLALDLLEELRHPVVDRFVLRTCNLRIFRPEMFESDPEMPAAVRLGRDGLKRFFREWETHLGRPLRERETGDRIAPRALLRRQVDRFAADLRGGEPYKPFLLNA